MRPVDADVVWAVCMSAGFVSCKKKNRNAKNMASATLYGGLKAFYCRRANLSLSFK